MSLKGPPVKGTGAPAAVLNRPANSKQWRAR